MSKRALEVENVFPVELWKEIMSCLKLESELEENYFLLRLMGTSKSIALSVIPLVSEKLVNHCLDDSTSVLQYSLALNTVCLALERELISCVRSMETFQDDPDNKVCLKNIFYYDGTSPVRPVIELGKLTEDMLPPDLMHYFRAMPRKYIAYDINLNSSNVRGLIYDSIRHSLGPVVIDGRTEWNSVVYDKFHVLGDSRKEFREHCFLFSPPSDSMISVDMIKRAVMLYCEAMRKC